MIEMEETGVRVTVVPAPDGAFEVKLEMPEKVFKEFQEIAEQRGRRFEDVLVEALRLERLFSQYADKPDRSFIIRDGNDFKELVTV